MTVKEGCHLCDLDTFKYLDPNKKFNRCIYRNESAMCAIDRDYLTNGHAIVIIDPQKINCHPDDFDDLKPNEVTDLMEVVYRCYNIIKQSDKRIDRIYVACLNESQHVHFHLIPRRKEDCWGFQFLGNKEIGRPSWNDISEYERKNRIDKIIKMIEEIGRHCNDCPSTNCSERKTS